MPRKAAPKAKQPKVDVNASRKYFCANDAEWGGYVNLKVREDERTDFDAWKVEEERNMITYVEECQVEGLKLGTSYDAEHSCYIATLTGAGCVGTPVRCVLTSRSDDWWEAIQLLMYKHYVLLDGDWSNYLPATGTVRFG